MYRDLKVTSGEVAANNVKSAPDRLQGTATENKNIFDKLVELFVGKYNSLLDELDTNEMTAVPPITISGYTISHANSGVTQGMYGTDQEQDPQHGEKFIVPYIIVDEHGHIVSAGNSEVQLPSGGGGGTSDYDDLSDKPQINSVTLSGNKSSSDLSLADETHTHTTSDISGLATVATTGDYDDLSDKPTIPTKTSDLNNDSGFLTSESDPVFTASDAYGISSSDISNWNNKSDFSGSYNDLTDKPTIPVKNIWYATCSTGASTTAKTATSQTADFVLSTGNMVRVLFTNTNTANSPTISIDGSTAKNIRIRSGSTGAMTYMWRDNEVIDLVYDGTNFVMSDGAIATTTYYGITSLSSSTSSTSETESATPKAVKTAYDLANGKSTVSVTQKTSSGTNIADLTIDGTTTQLYAPTGGGTSDYDSLSNRPQVNSVTLTGNKSSSDLGVADETHSHTTSDITDFPSLATVATTGDYDDLTDKPTIPTKVSDLNNDSGFITTESDPVFTASTAYGISSSDVTNWNAKAVGNGRIFYGTCTTSASTTVKSVTCTAYDTLTTGDVVVVSFTKVNSATSVLQMNVNSTGLKSIKQVRNGSLANIKNAGSLSGTCTFVYDGTYWVLQSTDDDTTYTIPTKTSDLTNDSGFLTAETDPVFTASDAYGISSSDITAWNGKSTVSLTRKTTSGTNIADITINGTTTELYAPSGGGGTSDYDSLSNRPSINSTTLTGNKTSSDLGVADASHTHTKSDITDFPTGLVTEDANGDVSITRNISAGGTITVGGHSSAIGDRQERSTSTTKSTGTSWTAVSTSSVYVTITAGTWVIQGTAVYAANSTGVRALRLYNNTTSSVFARSEDVRPAISVSGQTTSVHSFITVTASSSNTIVLQTFQNSGGTRNVDYYIEAVRIA